MVKIKEPKQMCPFVLGLPEKELYWQTNTPQVYYLMVAQKSFNRENGEKPLRNRRCNFAPFKKETF